MINLPKFALPLGISFFTFQSASYIIDVYQGKYRCQNNVFKLGLFVSFFPQLLQGPIGRYDRLSSQLYEGNSFELKNVQYGLQRICWGLAKKVILADRAAVLVNMVFEDYDMYGGLLNIVAVLMYSVQLYMDFSGGIDVVIGTAQMFGITMDENFRQPYFAVSITDFWHRWHITLGTWFKDYIFYPVSLAKPVKNFAKKVKNRFGRGVSKFVAPFAALFCVWSCNGLWHGPHWTYIFYGMYYFVLIFLENILEEPVTKLTAKLKINREGKGYRIFRLIKLLVIVNLGEMFFRAETVGTGFAMLGRILTNFHITELGDHIYSLGMDRYDAAVALIGILIVLVVDILHEKNIQIRKAISGWALPARWVFWYAAIFIVIIFGAYGA